MRAQRAQLTFTRMYVDEKSEKKQKKLVNMGNSARSEVADVRITTEFVYKEDFIRHSVEYSSLNHLRDSAIIIVIESVVSRMYFYISLTKSLQRVAQHMHVCVCGTTTTLTSSSFDVRRSCSGAICQKSPY